MRACWLALPSLAALGLTGRHFAATGVRREVALPTKTPAHPRARRSDAFQNPSGASQRATWSRQRERSRTRPTSRAMRRARRRVPRRESGDAARQRAGGDRRRPAGRGNMRARLERLGAQRRGVGSEHIGQRAISSWRADAAQLPPSSSRRRGAPGPALGVSAGIGAQEPGLSRRPLANWRRGHLAIETGPANKGGTEA